jgi:ADP-heptose:LPS heptosyltransferase
MRHFYNPEKAIEMFPPRGCSDFIEYTQQIFCKYTSSKLYKADKPYITVFPRARARASQRNVPIFIWYELIEKLRQQFMVVLAGTPGGACLVDYEEEDVVNMISYNEKDKTEKIIAYLNSSVCSISSQSGGTHISLLSGCPSYIIGHEKERHAIKENRIATPVSFRYTPDYRMIDADTILSDLNDFLKLISKEDYDDVLDKDIVKLNELVEARNE